MERPLRFYLVRLGMTPSPFLVAATSIQEAFEKATSGTEPSHIEIERLLDGNEPSLNAQLGREEA